MDISINGARIVVVVQFRDCSPNRNGVLFPNIAAVHKLRNGGRRNAGPPGYILDRGHTVPLFTILQRESIRGICAHSLTSFPQYNIRTFLCCQYKKLKNNLIFLAKFIIVYKKTLGDSVSYVHFSIIRQ